MQAADIPDRLVDYIFSGRPGAWIFESVTLCRTAVAPCGIELLSNENAPVGSLSKSLRQVPAATVLDLLISEHPEYQWVLDDGVINIIPRDTLWNRISRVWAGSPLDRKVKKLDVLDTTLQDAVSNIVCPAAGLQCFTPGWVGNGAAGDWSPPRKVSLHLENVTVRQALNALVRQDGHSMWILSRGLGKKIGIHMHQQ
jgi:hypothetical protein